MRTLQKRQQRLTNKDLAKQEAVLEDIFHDMYRNRRLIYRTNFFRGVFFGLGSVIGGTLVIAVVIALLSLLVQIPGGLGDFIEWVVKTIQNR